MPATDLRLNMGPTFANDTARNYRLPSWPPPNDFPVVVAQDGTVISRFGDSIWDLGAWHTSTRNLNFGDGPTRRGTAKVSPSNANTFRCVAAWWLWGPRPVGSIGTLIAQHVAIKNVFSVCTDEGIDARDLSRYPGVVDRLAKTVPPSAGTYLLGLLHRLFEQREQLNFVLLDATALRRLAANLPAPPNAHQTAYIPPRIWHYQVSRLREVLDVFNSNKEKIGACYWAALDSYAAAFGSYAAARDKAIDIRHTSLPGSFSGLARDFGIHQLLTEWYSDEKAGRDVSLYNFSNFLTLVNRAGLAYLLNYSLMRIGEAWSLRTDCLRVEQDEKLGAIYMLCGETTKTIADDDARWVTSPDVKEAIDAMATIGGWRIKVKQAYGDVEQCASTDQSPAHLMQPACEPWSQLARQEMTASQRNYICYSELLRAHPKLFDPALLRVTDEDWKLAKLVTPGLNSESFGVGRIWPLAWHQLRRTGAVNMQASGLVSNFSLQYQLKHSTLVSSLYYGQGYSQLSLNQSAQSEYLRAMYEVMGRELTGLLSDNFVSPYGNERKRAILQIVSESEHKKLVAAAKAGQVAWRQTLLGGCTKRGPCEYGGVDNIVRCGGGDDKAPCVDALFDKSRVSLIKRLSQMLSQQIADVENDTPYKQSLEAQRRAAENALNVLNVQ